MSELVVADGRIDVLIEMLGRMFKLFVRSSLSHVFFLFMFYLVSISYCLLSLSFFWIFVSSVGLDVCLSSFSSSLFCGIKLFICQSRLEVTPFLTFGLPTAG